MDKFLKSVLLCLLISVSTSYSQNNITTSVVPINNSVVPGWLTMVNDDLAWIQEVNDTNEVFSYHDGVISMINSPGDIAPEKLSLTETYIVWPARDLNFTSGFCGDLTPFGYYHLDGVLEIDNTECVDYYSNSKNVLRIYFNSMTGNREADIVGPDFNLITTLPTSYQTNQITYSNIATYWGENVFIKAFIGLEEYIFHLNVKTGVFSKVFQSSNIIFFRSYRNSESLVFSVYDLNSNQRDLYFYDGQSSSLEVPDVSLSNGQLFTFQDRIVWATTARELIQYKTGILDTLLFDDYAIATLNTTDCYMTWGTNDFTNNTSTLNLYNGNTIQTLNFTGVRVSFWTTQLDNDGFAFVLDDFSNNTYSIIKGDFEYSCCTGENIITNKNDNEFSHNFIESTTAFSCNTDPVYQALDYIELNPGFIIPEDYTFCASIKDECILFEE